MKKNDTTKSIILYLINKLGDKTEGKKKLMKLLFLIEHYDFSKKQLSPTPRVGNSFRIYYYGVFSLSVMRCVDDLIKDSKIKDGFPLMPREQNKSECIIDNEIKKQVDMVIDRFGDKKGYELEFGTLDMLGIKPHEKQKYFGEEVNKIIIARRE